MLTLILFLNLTIPKFENLQPEAGIDSKIEKYISAGTIDSAEYLAKKLLTRSKNLKTKRKALLYLYRIYKRSDNIKATYDILQKLLKNSGHSDSVALYVDYLSYLYNSKELNQIIELKDKVPPNDTLYFIISLAMFNMNQLDSALALLEECHIKEALYLKTFILLKLQRYNEAESLSKSLNWKELRILLWAQQQLWDSVVFSVESSDTCLNRQLLPYLRVLYFFSQKKLGAKVPLSCYKEWLTTNRGNPLEPFVLLLYAEDLGDKRKWTTALHALNCIDTAQFFSKFPSIKDKYFWIKGKALFYRGSNLKQITEHLSSALNLTQDQIIKDSCNYLLGLTYLKFSSYNKAIQRFQKIKENPHLRYDACYNLAMAYYQLHQYDDALKITEMALQKQNIPTELRLNLLKLKAKIYEAQKEYTKAISTYQSMLLYETRKSAIYEIFYYIEVLRYKKGDYETLEKAYQSYITKFPESPYLPHLYYDLLFNYIYSKSKDTARRILMCMIDKFPNNQKTLEAINLYFESPIASLEDSIILKELLAKNPLSEDYVFLTLGRLCKKLKLYDEAIKYFRRVKRETYYNQAQVEVMEIYFALNKYNEVEMLGMELMPDEIRDYTSYKLVELVLKALKNEGKAVTFNSLANHFASKDFPFKKDFCLMVSDIYIKEKDTTNAVKFLQIARDLGATEQEITNYDVELLKILREMEDDFRKKTEE